MNFNHLPLTTEDGTQLNLDALYKIAPSCFTEARDEKTGALRHVVDFKKLRQLLGDNAVEDEPEAYEFTWVGKNAARREAATPINKTLRPVPESSVDWDHTQNIYIEGDNLDALKLLQKSYLGKVKMIYIDPPYNTGNDFVYHDDFHRSQAEEDLEAGNVDELGNRFVKNTETNGKFHSDWCSMIYPRLQLAHTLLSEDGVIFISIDDNELDNLRKICDEIFGEDNFIATLIWEKKKKPSFLNANLGTKTDYILVYGKDRSLVGPLSVEVTEVGKKYPLNNAGNSLGKLIFPAKYVEFNMPDGHIIAQDMSEGNIKTRLLNDFDIEGGVNKQAFTLIGEWRYSQEKLDEIVKAGESIVISKIPFRPNHIKKGGEIKKMHNLLSIANYKIGTNEDATAEQVKLLGSNFFDYAKPSSLIKFIIKSCSYNVKNATILDFFSGSATTAHAVMQLNAEDGGHRKFILVQLPEETDEKSEAYKAGYKNICEIGEERIRRAGKKIQDELKAKQPELLDNDKKQPLDTGFRVFRIDSSNMKDVYFAPKDLKPQQLDLFADNVKEDRTELDLLYGCMVDWGVQLSLPLSSETIDGVTVYTVNDGDLVACFGKPITDKVVKEMADKAPLRVLFRDSCFEKDEQKINIFEQFKQLLGWSDDEALNNIRVI